MYYTMYMTYTVLPIVYFLYFYFSLFFIFLFLFYYLYIVCDIVLYINNKISSIII